LRDFGTESGRDYEVMAYAAGSSLDQFVAANGGIRSMPELKRLVGQIDEGLVFLHRSAGIIYQDLKPDNVFFSDREQRDLVLADFGISGCLNAGSTEAIVRANGTEEYAAPELARKMHQSQVMVSAAVDYFALGVTIYYLWLGRNPFDGVPAQQRDYMILQQSIDFPAEMDKELVLLLKGLLHPLAKDRWGSEHLRKWVKGEPLEDSIIRVQKPFKRLTFIGDEEFENRQQLAALLEKHPDQGIDYLYEGSRVIEKWIEEANNIQLLTAVQKVVKRYETDRKAGLFRVIHTLDPSRPYVTAAGTACANNYELGNALEAESGHYAKALTDPRDRLFVYIEAVGAEELADKFRAYFKDFTPESALNRMIIDLQGGIKRILLNGERFGSLAELSASADPAVQKAVLEQLCTHDSKLLCWLVAQGLLDQTKAPIQDGVDLFTMLLHFPWVRGETLVKAGKWEEYVGDYACDLVSSGRTDLLERYLELGYPLDARSMSGKNQGRTPLTLAAAMGDATMAAYLLDHGASIEAPTADGKTALIVAVDNHAAAIAKLLLDRGADHEASWNEVPALCRSLLPDGDPKDGAMTSLEGIAVAEELLAAGADPNACDQGGESALWNLVRFSGDTKESVDLAKKLIDSGAKLKQVNGNDLDLLQLAVIVYRDRKDKGVLLDIIEQLAKAGANPNRLNKNGNWSALMVAAQAGEDEVVKVLLRHGGRRSLSDSSNQIPYTLAKAQNHASTAALLRPSLLFRSSGFLLRVGYAVVRIALIVLVFFSVDILAKQVNRASLEPLALGFATYGLSLLLGSCVLTILTGSYARFWLKFKATVMAPRGAFIYFALMPLFLAPIVALLRWGINWLPFADTVYKIGGAPWGLIGGLPSGAALIAYFVVLGCLLTGTHFMTIAYVKAYQRYEAYKSA
jgi:ankyrin repeat protein